MSATSDSIVRQLVGTKRFTVAQFAAFALVSALVIWLEIDRWNALPDGSRDVVGWLNGINIDTTPYLFLLLLAPLAWRTKKSGLRLLARFNRQLAALCGDDAGSRRESDLSASADRTNADTREAGWLTWSTSIAIAVLSLAMSAHVGSQFGDLPPAYHDEFSYLFQAETFLSGRLWFPSHAEPRLFDQMHVLNEGRFASRYFPGTGLWMAPFVALGHPYWGHWLAGALIAFLMFWTGRELGGDLVGAIAGGLTALAPGMAVFSNLLLSHHPTSCGLALFLWGFFRMRSSGQMRHAVCAGAGLAFAMLCRPMTAAAVALPFGVSLLYQWLRQIRLGDAAAAKRTLRQIGGLWIPLSAGLVGFFLYNRAITDSGWVMPYDVYNKVYAPKQVYGFDNVIDGERHRGPRVLEHYDNWAQNLTPRLAAANVLGRLISSANWTLSIALLLATSVIVLIVQPRGDPALRLLLLGILALHAAYALYWFDGILHYSYVFESGLLWLLLFAMLTEWLIRDWLRSGRIWMPVWWAACVATSFVVNYGAVEPLWTPSRLTATVEKISIGRRDHAYFRQLVARRPTRGPAIILIDAEHIDYVVNSPDLQGEVLYARYLPDEVPLQRVIELFPDRDIYLYQVDAESLIPLHI